MQDGLEILLNYQAILWLTFENRTLNWKTFRKWNPHSKVLIEFQEEINVPHELNGFWTIKPEIGFLKMSGMCRENMLVLGTYWFAHKAWAQQNWYVRNTRAVFEF